MAEILIVCVVAYLVVNYTKKEKSNSVKYNKNAQERNLKNSMELHSSNADFEEDSNSNAESEEEKVKLDLSKSPFLMANSLLTKAEMKFYKVLQMCINENQVICPKIRMLDVLWTKTYYVEHKKRYINKIIRKHFDFVIADKQTLKPLLAVELDDKSHEASDRKERDEFVDELFSNFNFDVIHVKTSYYYNIEDLKQKIQNANTRKDTEESSEVEVYEE